MRTRRAPAHERRESEPGATVPRAALSGAIVGAKPTQRPESPLSPRTPVGVVRGYDNPEACRANGSLCRKSVLFRPNFFQISMSSRKTPGALFCRHREADSNIYVERQRDWHGLDDVEATE